MHTDSNSPTRLAILHAAAVMFAKQGVEHTTTDELIQAAACSTGTFYRCFGRKEHLPHAVYDYVHDYFVRAESWWPADFQGTTDERYDALLGRWLAVCDRALQQPLYFHFWLQYRSSPAGRARMREPGWVLGPFYDAVHPILTQLLVYPSQPLVPQPVGPALAAVLWMGHWTALLAYGEALPVPPPRTPEHVLVEAFRAWWSGLQAAPLPRPA